MGYYLRLFTKNDVNIDIEKIKIAANKYNAKVELNNSINNEWLELTLLLSNDIPICAIERNDVKEDTLGQEEIEEFLDEIDEYQPQKTVTWIKEYLKKVKVIYAFQLLSGSEIENGWKIFLEAHKAIKDETVAIEQQDDVGFFNEDGCIILLQVPDNTSFSGLWDAAILDDNGKWITFELNIKNKKQKKEFLEGKVPKSAKIVE